MESGDLSDFAAQGGDPVKLFFLWKALVQALPAPKANFDCWWAM
jgi:hypothetical protein